MNIHKSYTWPELLAEASRKSPWQKPSSVKGDFHFTASHSYDESLSLLTAGWQEGAEKIKRGLQTIGATHNAPRFALDVAGAFPHAPLAAAGDPACMFTAGEETRPRPALTLVCSFCCSAHIPTDSIFNHGLALCSVIDTLEQTGTRVELIAEMKGAKYGNEFAMAVTVKELNQPLDLYRIAYVFCHASMLRRTSFRVAELYMNEADWSGHYGHPATADADKFPPGSVFIPGPCHVSSLDEAKERIATLLPKD